MNGKGLKKKIKFIINPISGGKSKAGFPKLAAKHLNHSIFEPEYLFTEARGHAFELATRAVQNSTDIIVAVGGDGTINEVASAIEGTPKTMGIVPSGSGNGLARMLGISLNNARAISQLNYLNTGQIDTATFNEHKFFNLAGIGFDAHISNRFAKDKTRGLQGYVRTTFTEISQYEAQPYTLFIDGKIFKRHAFMISIANSSQFGNNAHVSPDASLQDGLLDVCIIKPFPLYHFPVMGYHMFSKTAHRSKYVEIIKGKDIRISRQTSGAVHIDGEPLQMGKELVIQVKPASLHVLN